MNELVKDLARAGRFRPAASYQRFAYACGALLILSGLFHAAVYLVDGGPWEGPVSWRKPIVFGLSFGVTLMTVSWIMTFLRPRRGTGWIVLGIYSVAALGEVFLISMQRWRGVASHFNEDTAFDERVFSAMGMLVTLVGLMTLFVALRSFFPMDAAPSLAWAIRTGLVLMLVSHAVGVQMIAEGGNTFGAAGALKVPHAFTLHAVQVLPALAIALSLSHYPERRRVEVVALGGIGYVAIIGSTLVQTYAGRGPLELGAVAAVLALLGLGLLATSALIAVRDLGARSRPPDSPQRARQASA